MIRRHQASIPLTHDHHRTLAQARRLTEPSTGDIQVLRRAADDFVNLHLGRARHHFHGKEEVVFAPLVDDETVGPLIGRAVTKHLRPHAQVRMLRRQLRDGEIAPEVSITSAELLESRVRFEEKGLLPLIEQGISESSLSDLASTGRRDV